MELIWPGKYDDEGRPMAAGIDADPLPLRLVEVIGEVNARRDSAATTGRLIHGDNKNALAALLHEYRGRVDLIYIDPPFAAGGRRKLSVAGPSARRKATAPTANPTANPIAYDDAWGAGKDDYLQMMLERLLLLRELLSDRGTIYVHCDGRANYLLRLLLDEVFGAENFRNEIAWCYRGGGVPKRDFAAKHDTILRYSKTGEYYFDVDAVRTPYSDDVLNSSTARYDKSYRDNKIYDGYRPHERGKHPDDWWPIQPLMPSDKTERVGYPTQKPVELLQRIVDASCPPGGLVLDAFCGSGTTAVVAAGLRVRRTDSGKLEYFLALPRPWIAIDSGNHAIHACRKRLLDVARRQRAAERQPSPIRVYRVGPADDERSRPRLTVEPVFTQRGEETTVDVRLVSFQPSVEAAGDPLDLLDYWAVDFDAAPGGPFRSEWQSFRTPAGERPATLSNGGRTYTKDGDYRIRAMAIDRFGAEEIVEAARVVASRGRVSLSAD